MKKSRPTVCAYAAPKSSWQYLRMMEVWRSAGEREREREDSERVSASDAETRRGGKRRQRGAAKVSADAM